MTNRTIKTVNRTSKFQTKELMMNDEIEKAILGSGLCSTETWHKMNLAFLTIKMAAYSNRRWRQ